MTTHVPVSAIKQGINAALNETFDQPIGMFLDKGDALWQTLDNVTAEQASVPIAEDGNSIAGQVAHMTFYLDVMAAYMRNEPPEKPDWADAWKTVKVDAHQWQDLKRKLAERQSELLTLINAAPEEVFKDPDILGGSYALVGHNAFHLGQIRHALAAQGQ